MLQCSIGNAVTGGEPLGGTRSARKAVRLGWMLPASSVARLASTAGDPSQFHGMRKRVSALLSTGVCSAASPQLLPPSADTSTLLMRPLPDHDRPETS